MNEWIHYQKFCTMKTNNNNTHSLASSCGWQCEWLRSFVRKNGVSRAKHLISSDSLSGTRKAYGNWIESGILTFNKITIGRGKVGGVQDANIKRIRNRRFQTINEIYMYICVLTVYFNGIYMAKGNKSEMPIPRTALNHFFLYLLRKKRA